MSWRKHKNEKGTQYRGRYVLYMIADTKWGNSHGIPKNCILDKKYHVEVLDID